MYTCAPMYPGPSSIHTEALRALAKDYYPARYSKEYQETYNYTCKAIQRLCNTNNDVLLATGEAMLGLWTALKSCLIEGDKVLTIGTGVFGDGFADMASALGCEVCKLSFGYDTTIIDENLVEIEKAIDGFNPKMITVIHCETPSGTLNPLDKLGALKKKKNVPLLVVDAVASMGGAEILCDDWNVDILIGGSQKCFSCPADLTILAVSKNAWNYIDKVNYVGYDALKPFMGIGADVSKYPYTPNAQSVYALAAVLKTLESEGFLNVYKRHIEVSNTCIQGIKALGLKLYPVEGAISSPTCTAIYVPDGHNWKEMHAKVLQYGVFLGGSYGNLEGKVFRIGHMGTQANLVLIEKTLTVLKDYLNK